MNNTMEVESLQEKIEYAQKAYSRGIITDEEHTNLIYDAIHDESGTAWRHKAIELSESGAITTDELLAVLETRMITCAYCGKKMHTGNETILYWNIGHGAYACKDCMDERYVKCADCGRYIPPEDGTTVAYGGIICDDCLENYRQCGECGEWYIANDMQDTHDGYICQNCIDSCDYTACADCGCYVPIDTITRVRDRDRADEWEWVCDDCLDSNEYVQCDRCGEYVHRGWAHIDDYDHTVCDYCYDRYNYSTCYECGCLIDEDSTYYDDNSGEWYCEECYNQLESINSYIHSYHDGASCGLRFYETVAEPTYNDHIRYFGIELEVDNGDRDAAVADVFNALNGTYDQYADRYAHFENDGSLSDDGFEIITQPMSREYLETFRPRIEEATRILTRAGFRSHDARMCGLHIHVSRDTLTPEIIDNMIYTISLFWHTCVRISRRTPNQLAQYARSYACKNESEPDDTPDKVVARAKDVMRECKHDRYFALNTTNTNTIELRICRGTLNVDTIYASLDFFAALIKFAETYSETDMMKMSVDDFNSYLKNYSDRLAAYMEERGL